MESATNDESLRQAAEANPEDKFALVFKNLIETIFVERMAEKEEIFIRFMNDGSFQKAVVELMTSDAYRKIREAEPVRPTWLPNRKNTM